VINATFPASRMVASLRLTLSTRGGYQEAGIASITSTPGGTVK
jgi:hypothetical protein